MLVEQTARGNLIGAAKARPRKEISIEGSSALPDEFQIEMHDPCQLHWREGLLYEHMKKQAREDGFGGNRSDRRVRFGVNRLQA